MKLIKYSGNWADEIDVSGYKLMTEDQWNEYLQDFKQKFEEDGEYNFCIGTNEDVEYSSFKGFEAAFKVKDIDDQEAKVLKKHLGESFGFFPELE